MSPLQRWKETNLGDFPAAESCMHIAASLGHSFSIIVVREKCIPQMREKVVRDSLPKNSDLADSSLHFLNEIKAFPNSLKSHKRWSVSW
jgi:hypothetical protein